jgi:hypothetical protein
MKLDEILEEMEKDSVIDRDRLDTHSLEIPKVHAKWLKIYAQEKRLLNSLKLKLTELIHAKTEFYGGRAPAEEYKKANFQHKLLKAEVPKYVEADPDVLKLASGIDQVDERIYVIQEFIKSINQRSYNIRNAVEYMRWTSGG